MQQLKILNTRERKDILKTIKSQWGADIGAEFVFLYSERKEKAYIIIRDIENIELEHLHIDSLGLYFGELMGGIEGSKEQGIRLSIEGSQIVGPLASKNVIELSDEDAESWIRGQNVFNKAGAEGWAIIKHNDDFMGCGRVKEKVVMNFISKARRINVKSESK